jgi:Ala-tRNA(Pro) deacylase
MTIFQKITAFLDQHHIHYDLIEHPPVKTSEEAAKIRVEPWKLPFEALLAMAAKALVVRSNSQFFLFVLPGTKRMNWKTVKFLVRNESASLATPDEVIKVSSVPIGSVPPFGNLFEPPVKVFMERSLSHGEICFNPGEFGKSIKMKREDYLKLVDPQVADFAE